MTHIHEFQIIRFDDVSKESRNIIILHLSALSCHIKSLYTYLLTFTDKPFQSLLIIAQNAFQVLRTLYACFGNILIAIGLTEWLSMARIVRGQILSMREQDFALAARCLGASRWRILFRHLIPNSVGPIIVTATLTIPQAIFLEAFLSFIGLGVSAPMASWGVLASDGLAGIRSYPWQLLAPAIAISVTMLAFNFLGDGLRDALDPRLRS